ncbi:MAG TPA: hypothetical protein VGU63_08115 [Candidatus Acidoferrales bacterium]|nr:hypothetical protein [Candidatus Acidoferrales bacterium]
MPETAHEIPGDLMLNDERFRNLAQQLSRYEEQLQQLIRETYRSSEDILLETKIKKMKLRLKDEMQQLITRRRRESRAS